MKKIHRAWFAWLFYSLVIFILIVNGIFFPYHGKHGAGILDLLTFEQITYVIGPIFAWLAFFGTAKNNQIPNIKNKRINFTLVILIRILSTLIQCIAAYGILFLLFLTTCAFGAGECCC